MIIGGGKRSTSQSNVTSLSPFFDSTSSLESSNFFTSITKQIQRRHIFGMSPIMHDFKGTNSQIMYYSTYFEIVLPLSLNCPNFATKNTSTKSSY